MALSQEAKDALSEHFRNRDQYDPSKEAAQEVATFAPKGMSTGSAGYADGGSVDGGIDLGLSSLAPGTSDYSGPALSADTDTAHVPMTSPPPSVPTLRADLQLPKDVQAAPQSAMTAPVPSAAAKQPPVAPPAVGGKLQPDQFDAMIKALTPSTGQRMGMGAMSALAGLADAIETGVARTNGSNFQKNLTEQGQKEREDLINALRAKYETKFKGRELSLGESKAAEEARHNKSAEQIGAEEAGARLSEAKQGLQQNALEAMGRLSESGGVTGRVFGQPAAADQAIKALAQRAGLASGQQGPVTVHTKAEWAALPKGTHYVDPNGKPGVKK
jgi:hypothetical protein